MLGDCDWFSQMFMDVHQFPLMFIRFHEVSKIYIDLHRASFIDLCGLSLICIHFHMLCSKLLLISGKQMNWICFPKLVSFRSLTWTNLKCKQIEKWNVSVDLQDFQDGTTRWNVRFRGFYPPSKNILNEKRLSK